MNYVIFSSKLSLIAMAVIAVLYILTLIFKSSKCFASVLAVLNIIAHLGLMLLCMYLKATLAEFLFLLTASTAMSLMVMSKRREE